MHFPEVILLTRRFRSQCADHRICMNAHEREVMKFQPELIRIAAQDLLHKGMVGTTTGTLVIAEFNQRYLRVFRPTEVATTLDFDRGGVGNLRPTIGVAAEKYGRTRSDNDKDNDDESRFQELLHADILARLALIS